MFGYESLPEGLVMFFEVESELSETINLVIENALMGEKRVGRSRSAQYGLVRIEKADFKEVKSSGDIDGDYVTVYADGRLIFLNENGEPVFQPSADALGIKDGTILWEKSQVRTFQYSPWNGKRSTYDTDRCGIEKGSVFVVKGGLCPERSKYVGAYKNEGFGKVIYNPDFLKGKEGGNGEALYTLEEKSNVISNRPTDPSAVPDTPLVVYLTERAEKERKEQAVYATVSGFVERYGDRFKKDERFASQWGSIRSFAMAEADNLRLTEAIEKFLEHGVAKYKWEERGRKEALMAFMKRHSNENLQRIIVNLASEMAKRCKKVEE